MESESTVERDSFSSVGRWARRSSVKRRWRSGAHATGHWRSVAHVHGRRLGRAAGDPVSGAENDEVAMRPTGSRHDEECVVARLVERVADVLACSPLLLGGQRWREGQLARGAGRRRGAPRARGRCASATDIEGVPGRAEVQCRPRRGTTPPMPSRVRRRGTRPRRSRRAASDRRPAGAVRRAGRRHARCGGRRRRGRRLSPRRWPAPYETGMPSRDATSRDTLR